MTHTTKHSPRIAFLGLSLELYQQAIPDTIPKYEAFFRKLSGILAQEGEVSAEAICYTRAEVDGFVARAEGLRVDALVVVLLSYHPSLNALGALTRGSRPLLIWNTQQLAGVGPEFNVAAMLENHGIHGAQDLCNCLRRSGRTFGIVSGHYQDARHLRDLREWLAVCTAVSFSRQLQVGLLGRPFQGMGDFGVDETRMLTAWGPAVEQLTLAELAELAAGVSEVDLREEMACDRELFDLAGDVTEEDHRRSARLSLAVRRQAEAHGLHALTQHFGVYGEDPRIETCPFLGFNHLIAQGCGYAGEGNVTIAALDAVLGRIWGPSNFCEMFTADFERDQLFFYHMGEGNYALARGGRKPLLKKVPYTFGDGHPYLAPVFGYEPGPSTFVNLTTDGQGKFRLIAFEAELNDYVNIDAFTAPHFKAQIEGRLGDFLDSYGFAGGTHHLTRARGRRLQGIARLARMLEMELTAL